MTVDDVDWLLLHHNKTQQIYTNNTDIHQSFHGPETIVFGNDGTLYVLSEDANLIKVTSNFQYNHNNKDGIHHHYQHHIPELSPSNEDKSRGSGGGGGSSNSIGELHHSHTVHFNAKPNEEGITKLSWELVASCLFVFVAVLLLWLRFALLCSPTNYRRNHNRRKKK